MNTLETLQRTTAHNLSAASVPGFKKTIGAVEAQPAGTLPSMTGTAHAPSQPGRLPDAAPTISYQAGALAQSGNPLDFALKGEGFFSLQMPEGQTLYTRNGSFHVDAEGQLVNALGYPVLSGGREISVDPALGPVTAMPDGTLRQGEVEIGQLELTKFGRPDLLSQTTGGFLQSGTMDAGAEPAEDASVIQGFTEHSNVNPVHEMVSLITISRAYEVNEKVLSAYDDRLGKTIEATKKT